jgi:hypothetical protein
MIKIVSFKLLYRFINKNKSKKFYTLNPIYVFEAKTNYRFINLKP